ncbi:MAG: hypothetical protein ACTFAK_05430 [Candidatus Electronema sp. VV]
MINGFEPPPFKDRFNKNAVTPIWFSDVPPIMFDESRKYGGITFNVDDDFITQANQIADVLIQKLAEDRSSSKQL